MGILLHCQNLYNLAFLLLFFMRSRTLQDGNYLENIRSQYEQYPYPPREPQDEIKRLLEVELDRLATINFYCFKGKQSFDNVKILIAGGGTGDSTIFLAEQLRHKKNAEVVYLDISLASIAIVKQRAKIRRLNNIRWIHGSIMSLPDYDIGPFDYINCTGVLHHLDEPAKGIACLKSVLKPSGAFGVMLYGKYGRTGVYQMQKLLKLINQNESELSGRIENTRKIINELPATNWFCHNQEYINDHTTLGDSGLVDLLLHEQDVSYSIDEIYQLLDSAKLNFVEFCSVKMRLAYRPEQYISNQEVLSKIKLLSVKQQQQIAELLVGAFKKHEFYVSNETSTKADFYDIRNIPFFFPEKLYADLGQIIAQEMERNPQGKVALKHVSGYEFDILSSQIASYFFKQIDGKKSLQTIFERIRHQIGSQSLDNQKIYDCIQPYYQSFQQLDWLLLRAPDVGFYPDGNQYQTEFLEGCRTGTL